MKNFRLFLRMVPVVLLLLGCAKEPDVDPRRAAETNYQLGMAYFSGGDFQRALPEFAKAVELNPSEPLYHDAMGTALMFNRRLDAAIAQFKEAIRLDPKFTEAKNNLASAYLLKGDLDQARAALNEVLQDPLYATPQFAYFNLAKIYEREGKDHEAIVEYKRAVDIDRDYVDAHNSLGILYLRTGKIHLAVEEFTEATRLNPRVALYQRNLGVAYMEIGKGQEARRAFERVLEIERDGPSAEYARKMLEQLK